MLLRVCPFLLLLLAPAFGLFAAEPADIASLRAKAEKGNAIAQYNLGLAYAEGESMPVDLPEAFVWLTLASENGSTGKALSAVQAKLTPTQIADGHKRVETYRAAIIASQFKSAPLNPTTIPPSPPVNASMASGSFRSSGRAVSRADSEVDSLRNDRHQLSEELAAAWRENNQLKASIDALTQKLADATAAAKRDAEAKANVGSAAQFESLQSQLTALKAKLVTSESARADFAIRHKTDAANLKAVNDQLSALQKQFQAQASTKPAPPADNTAKLAALNAELEVARQKLTTSESLRSELANQLAPLRAQLKETQAVADSVHAQPDISAALTKKQQELASTQAALAQARTRLEELTAVNAKLGAAAASDAQKDADLAAARQELFTAREHLSAYATETTQQTAALDAARRDVAAARAESAALREKASAIHVSTSAETAAAPEATRAKEKNAALLTDVASLRAEKQQLNDRLAAADQAEEKSRLALAAASSDLAAARAQVARLEATRNAADTSSVAQAGQVSALQAAAADLRKQLNAAEAARAALEIKAKADVEAADKTTGQLTGFHDKIQALEEERANLQKQLTAAQAAPARVDPARSEAEAKLALALRSYSVLESENASLKAGNDRLTVEKTTLANDLGAAKSTADTLKLQSDSATAAAAETTALRAQLQQAQAQITALTNENSGLKAQPPSTAPADLEALRTRATEAEHKLADAEDSRRALVAENSRLKSALAQATLAPRVPAENLASAPIASPFIRSVGAVASGPSSPTRPGSLQAATLTAPPPAVAPKPEVRTHLVVPGDTLGKISHEYYGTASRWPEILAANRDVLRDERSLVVGRTLRIP